MIDEVSMRFCFLILLLASSTAFAQEYRITSAPSVRNEALDQRKLPDIDLVRVGDAAIIATTYAAARYAEQLCRADDVKINYVFFRQWIARNNGQSSEMKNFMRKEILAAKKKVASDIFVKGADDWCDDFTTEIFWNYTAPDGPIYYHDELGLWWSPVTNTEEARIDILGSDFPF